MVNEYNKIFESLYKLNQDFKSVNISDIGCFELSVADVYSVFRYAGIPKNFANLFFFEFSPGTYLSRTTLYYDFKDFYKYKNLFITLLSKTIEYYEESNEVVWVLNALLDYYENYLVTYWYALWEICIDNNKSQKKLYKYCEKIEHELKQVIIYHLCVYTQNKPYIHLSNEVLAKQCNLIDESMAIVSDINVLSYRIFREFDNRVKCINEIVYDIYALEQECVKIDNLLMPLYGAALLAVYAEPVLDFFGIGQGINVLHIRIGFHDLLQLNLSKDFMMGDEKKIAPKQYLRYVKKMLKDKSVLVIDDNVGYGGTIICCKKFVEMNGGMCYSRTAETSWNRILESDIQITVDYPSIFNYYRYSRQYTFIECLKNNDSNVREYEFKICNRYVTKPVLLYKKLTNKQIERMERELAVKKSFDIVDFDLNYEKSYRVCRVNIDILDGKSTVDESLNINNLIAACVEKNMDICIVDLNKSIYGISSDEFEIYLSEYPNCLWAAGGITNVQEVQRLLDKGAKGIIIGSAIYREDNVDVGFVYELLSRFGTDNVCFSLDYYEDNIVVKGFEKKTDIKLDSVLAIFNSLNTKANVILVDINASKNKQDIDFKKIKEIKTKYTNISFWYGGNISEWNQVDELNHIHMGAILGKNYLRKMGDSLMSTKE